MAENPSGLFLQDLFFTVADFFFFLNDALQIKAVASEMSSNLTGQTHKQQ